MSFLLHLERAPDHPTVRARHTPVAVAVSSAVLLAIAIIGAVAVASAPTRHRATAVRPPAQVVHQLAAASTSQTSPASPDAGDPTATITSPASGASTSAGTTVTLVASLSPDLVSALQAGTGRCYFLVGNDANSTATATLNLQAATCSGSWTYSYSGTFAIVARIDTPSGTTYSSAPSTLTVNGSTNARCTGLAGAPSNCVYRWAEIYYDSSSTRRARVCSINGGCQWLSTHTSWQQTAGMDFWLNRAAQPMTDGNLAELFACFGSSPADWNAYTTNSDFDALTSKPETNIAPIQQGICTA